MFLALNIGAYSINTNTMSVCLLAFVNKNCTGQKSPLSNLANGRSNGRASGRASGRAGGPRPCNLDSESDITIKRSEEPAVESFRYVVVHNHRVHYSSDYSDITRYLSIIRHDVAGSSRLSA